MQFWIILPPYENCVTEKRQKRSYLMTQGIMFAEVQDRIDSPDCTLKYDVKDQLVFH